MAVTITAHTRTGRTAEFCGLGAEQAGDLAGELLARPDVYRIVFSDGRADRWS